MLFKSTVEPKTFSLLKDLLKLEELKNFALVGGTALSLKYGHRKSVDLDLFSTNKFDVERLSESLKFKFGESYRNESPNVKFGIFCYINDVKIDLIHYNHQFLYPTETTQGIRMFSIPDIAAMKINAILGRGAKKDFWDLALLLKHFQLKEIIEFHRLKFPNQQLLISIPNAITYFADAEESPEPISLNGQTWEDVKKSIQKAVRDFL